MKKIIQALTSYRAMVCFFLVYAVALAAATFIEHRWGTTAARTWVYNNLWFYLWQFLLVVNFIGVAMKQKLIQRKKWAVLVFHGAFILILIGALVTRTTGREGLMHIRQGETTAVLLDPEHPDRISERLSFSVTLESFTLERYPGSNSPSSFESRVVVHQPGRPDRSELIYMNNVLRVDGYRLYQTSYDPDEQGTLLTVNHDPIGMGITYAGYVLLIGGMLLALFSSGSRFRSLARQLKEHRAALLLVLMFGLGSFTTAQAQPQEGSSATAHSQSQEGSSAFRRERDKKMAETYAVDMPIDPTLAAEFGQLMVQNAQGRVEPIDTYAAKLLRKIYRKSSYAGLSPDQVLLGAIMAPNVWSRVSFIQVGNEQLRKEAGGGDDKGCLAFIDVLDDQGDYRFANAVEATYAKPARERNKYDKELLKLDERVNILMSLFRGEMLAIFPPAEANEGDHWHSPGDDLSAFRGEDSMFVARIFPWLTTASLEAVESGQWTTPREIVGMIVTYQTARVKGLEHADSSRIQAEMRYNRLEVFKWGGFLGMGIGLMLMLALIFGSVGGGTPRRAAKIVVGVLTGIAVGLLLWDSLGVGLRWYISGRPPLSNAYESLIFVGWATALAGVLFGWRSRMTMALAIFLSGVLFFVSNLNWMDPEITPLVPVLKSPWLLIHVAAVTGSYAFFGIGFLLGLVALVLMVLKNSRNAARLEGQITEFTLINEMILTAGLWLLTAGVFIGAVWANESWGRYWGWDPKETWALITLVIYAFVIHARFLPALRGAYAFNLTSVLALGTVLMTFFGVNYYLSGMHSYGGDSAPPGLYAIWVVYALVALVAVLAWRKRRKN